MSRYYAGIGSRALPEGMYELLYRIGVRMAQKGFTLRSGAADGADSAFENGAVSAKGTGHIYLPWSGFKGRHNGMSNSMIYIRPLPGQRELSRRLMLDTDIIPHWDRMSETSQKFHSRNVNQIEGDKNAGHPDVEVVIYYAPTDWATGEVQGGTRTAVELAKHKGIPTYNMYDEGDKHQLLKKLDLEE